MIGTSIYVLTPRSSSKYQFSKRLFPRAHLGKPPLDKTCPYGFRGRELYKAQASSVHSCESSDLRDHSWTVAPKSFYE